MRRDEADKLFLILHWIYQYGYRHKFDFRDHLPGMQPSESGGYADGCLCLFL